MLRRAGHLVRVIAGVITNNSVEATPRTAGNLGFETYLVEDARFTFPRTDIAGCLRCAEDFHAMPLAELEGEYCSAIPTEEAIQRLD